MSHNQPLPLSERDPNQINTPTHSKAKNAYKAAGPKAAVSKAASLKRKSDTIDDDDQALPEISDFDPRLITDSYQVLRHKMKNFVDSGAMKKADFIKALDVNAAAYHRFMGQYGKMAGAGSQVYPQGSAFFKKRELQGLKDPRPKPIDKKARLGAEAAMDVSGIKLDDEEGDMVPVYDTCDEIRRKICAFMKKHNLTQADFVRGLAKAYTGERSLQGALLSRFLGLSGPRQGLNTSIFYVSYVFSEKLHLRDGKSKTQMREEMKDYWDSMRWALPSAGRGMDIDTRANTAYICSVDSIPVVNEYGAIEVVPR